MIFSAGLDTANLTSTGLFKMVLANCCILAGIVAENMTVCRSFGRIFDNLHNVIIKTHIQHTIRFI